VTRRSVSSIRASRASKPTRRCATTTRSRSSRGAGRSRTACLYEGGGSISLNAFGTANFGTALDGSDYEECGQSEPFRVNIADAARGANYHGVGAIGIGISNLFVGRFATSYVTGAHNFKPASISSAATSPATPSTVPTTWAACRSPTPSPTACRPR
jgi:hypothetical protein